ncbi:succinyl-diaminopimelate desuccinylase [Microbacterium sp. SLBN-154]|uniref:M20/M25/M40 family metallo-hydrolase n=1 Tax=Microbacterium sp. SLBN-154 TaxID=2768458 RepID=UPI001151B6DD|nr:M20/M25/M40 family metallo-hydrolase [Microbacterium sp. SLBN-154]TQK17636.1 succinyl-diaminopimelate desuccinylase [Microbacterium sp. SLBN-154]
MTAVVTASALARRMEGERDSLVKLCAELVAAPSVNPPGDTREVSAVVTRFLRSRGIESRLVALDPLMPCVVAEVDSGRPGPHLVLNVHLDTMPPGEEAEWTQPIWSLTQVAGRLYGLGMGNMKGAVAAMAHALAALHDHRDLWRGRVTFTAVSDEVAFGPHGSAHLLDTIPGIAGDALICGEGPGFRRLALGEKGVLWLRIDVAASGGHASSVRRGKSAAAVLARAMGAVDALTGTRGTLEGALADIRFADTDSALALTASVGVASAGTFVSQVASRGHAEIDLRLPPGISTNAAQRLVEAAVHAATEGADVTVRRLKGWDPNITSPESGIVQAWRQSWAELDLGELEYAIRLPASDASRWRTRGTPAICYGPQPTFSAGVDDYAEEDEVVRCATLYAAAAMGFLDASVSDEAGWSA